MTTPGSNQLRRAARLIKLTPIQYFKYQTRSLNTNRVWIPVFANFVTLKASVQAVDRRSYIQLGLDLQRNYVDVFAQYPIVDLGRDVAGDQFVFNGHRYQIESQESWFFQDGWATGQAVQIGAAS